MKSKWIFAVVMSLGLAWSAAAQETYRIGGIFPLTGNLSWLGAYGQKAAQLQVDQINSEGGVNGRKLELIVYDDQSSPEAGARAAQRLLSRDQVVAIIGTDTVPVSGAVAAIANERQIPVLIHSGYAVDPKKEPFVFNTAHRTEFAVERPFMYFAREGRKRIALFMPVGPLGDIGIAAAEKAAAKHGIELVASERFNPQSSDLTTQLAQLRARKPDAVFSFVTGEPAAMVARNMQQIRFDVPLLVSHGNATPGFLRMAGNLDVNIIVPAGPLTLPDQIEKDHPAYALMHVFNEAHRQRFNEPANYYSGLSADAIRIVAHALKETNSTEGPVLRNAIERIKGMPGYTGVFNMSPDDHHGTTAEDLVLLRPTPGGWKLIK